MAKTQDKEGNGTGPTDPKAPPPADPKGTPPAKPPTPPGPPAEKAKSVKVRVICEGSLGTKLLEKGAITDDLEYVAILAEKGQRKVEEVK